MSERHKIAIFSNGEPKGGVYNILGSFSVGLKEGLENNADIFADYHLNFPNPQVCDATLGFNVTAYEHWDELLQNYNHIMWSVDSCFAHNSEVICQYLPKNNFYLFGTSKVDIEPLKYFFPNHHQKYFYMPHSTDPKKWSYNNEKKDIDLIFFSSIADPQKIVNEAKNSLPKNYTGLYDEVLYYTKEHLNESFWNIFKKFVIDQYKLSIEQQRTLYCYFFKNLLSVIYYQKKIDLVKSLDNIGVQIYGNDVWQKYITGKNQYMGVAEFNDTIKLAKRAKVNIHYQHLHQSLHERLLNFTLTNCGIVTNYTSTIYEEFGDNFIYTNDAFSNIEEKVRELINNNELRNHKIKQAQQIVLKKHTWEKRADDIAMILSNFKETKLLP